MNREQVLQKYRELFDRSGSPETRAPAWAFLRKQDIRLRREGKQGVIETHEEYQTRRKQNEENENGRGAVPHPTS